MQIFLAVKNWRLFCHKVDHRTANELPLILTACKGKVVTQCLFAVATDVCSCNLWILLKEQPPVIVFTRLILGQDACLHKSFILFSQEGCLLAGKCPCEFCFGACLYGPLLVWNLLIFFQVIVGYWLQWLPLRATPNCSTRLFPLSRTSQMITAVCFASTSGTKVTGKKWLLMTDCPPTMDSWFSCTPQRRMNSGALCWRRPTPSE